MEIRPGKGVGQLLFGNTEAELACVLGPADKRYLTDSEALRLQYFGLRLEFSIEPMNEDRFGWVEVRNPDATLFGRRVVGEPIDRLLAFVSESLGEEPEHEDYGSVETFFYSRNWVELQVEFGRLASVNCGVVYDDSGEPLWAAVETAIAKENADLPLEISASPHPLAHFAGMFVDDPGLDEWKKSMKGYRRNLDKDAEKP